MGGFFILLLLFVFIPGNITCTYCYFWAVTLALIPLNMFCVYIVATGWRQTHTQLILFTGHRAFKSAVKPHLQTPGALCDCVYDTWRLWGGASDNTNIDSCAPSPVWLLGCVCLVVLLHCHSATLHLHKMLINHRSNPVTFALFKNKLQTLAFRKYNFLPLHISAALWAVYLTVFDYRLTFVLYF